jgi:outer membrane protein OmpA-like peptidoglycan-associated protein
MKKVLVLISVLTLVFFAVFGILTCKGITPVKTADEPAPLTPLREYGAPELAVSLSPRLFSPDGDGVDDELFMAISCKDESPIEEWILTIKESGEPNQTFFERYGKGSPPAQIVWDGRSSVGELVQSAMDYPFTLTVKNIRGLSSTHQGFIGVDVLVIREGNQMRVQVPSIVFGSNSGGFTGLNQETLNNNDYILRRIAQVLNKFDTYKVIVEGHANLTAATEAARRLEQERELRPLSEQRARFVVDYLVKLGVDRSRLTAVGVGGARPVARYEDRGNWWKNRRVEFILAK